MKLASRCLFTTMSMFVTAGVAVAQTAPATPAEGETQEATATDPQTTATPDPAAAAATTSGTRWPRDVISRVLTYPKGILALGFDVGTSTSSFFDPALLRPSVGYGITDDFELNFASYAFSTDDAGKGSIDAGVGFKLLRGAAGGKLEVIARAQTGYSLALEALNPLGLGAHVQYNITPKVAVITPGNHLVIGLDDPNPIAFRAPVALGVQPTPELYLQVDTTLFNVDIKDSANAFIFSDTTPVALTAIYNAVPALDVIAAVGLDLTPPEVAGAEAPSVGDTVTLTVGARYYIGQL